MNYEAYVAQFNAGDDAYLVEKYFTEDCIVASARQFLRGREAVLKFLESAHDGVREIMRPQVVLQDQHHIFAEIDMDFHASKGRPDFPFGALLPGDTITVKFFMVYRTRGEQIAEIRSSAWLAGHGVSRAPRLGGDAGQRAAFQAYIRAFSEAQFERFASFYTEDVVLELPALPPLRGREAIVDHYREQFQTVRENLLVHQLVADTNGIAADMTTRFTALQDAPGFALIPLARGESASARMLVYYTLREGLISHVQVAKHSVIPETPQIPTRSFS